MIPTKVCVLDLNRLYSFGLSEENKSLYRYLDGVSSPISIEVGFPFFDNVYSTAYVSLMLDCVSHLIKLSYGICNVVL